MKLLTAAQMRGTEQTAIAAGDVTGLALMERAGAGVVAALGAHWPGLVGRAVVLCGPGNNGGDGYVIARLLRGQGWQVTVRALGDPARLPPDALANHRRWLSMGPVAPLTADFEDPPPDLVVDALFGTGLKRPVALPLDTLCSGAGGAAPRVVAVDLPSGLCSDSGRILGAETAAVRADLTVTFHRPKLGHYLADGPGLCGDLRVVDIGLPDRMGPEQTPVARLVTMPDPTCLTKAEGHKFSHGHALVLSGGVGRGGAARLAARAALRIGAGVVTLGCPPAALLEAAIRLEAVMVRKVADGPALSDMLEDARINALCLGPGLGTDAAQSALVAAALARPDRGLCLDADALTLLARDPGLMARLHGGCVLTPHWGEFRRLFPDLAERLAAPAMAGPAWSRVDAVRIAARRVGCTVLLKGADTVIATADGDCAVHAAAYDRAAPWLATAGAGDVLAGLITGLMARRMAPAKAAQTAAWLHVSAARAFGPGLIAEDLPECLPQVLQGLGA